jgi:hypothetical protein
MSDGQRFLRDCRSGREAQSPHVGAGQSFESRRTIVSNLEGLSTGDGNDGKTPVFVSTTTLRDSKGLFIDTNHDPSNLEAIFSTK